MHALKLQFDLSEGEWAKYAETLDPRPATISEVGTIAEGTVDGSPVVAMIITTEDGRQYFAQTTLAIFLAAADGMRAYYQGKAEREEQQ